MKVLSKSTSSSATKHTSIIYPSNDSGFFHHAILAHEGLAWDVPPFFLLKNHTPKLNPPPLIFFMKIGQIIICHQPWFFFEIRGCSFRKATFWGPRTCEGFVSIDGVLPVEFVQFLLKTNSQKSSHPKLAPRSSISPKQNRIKHHNPGKPPNGNWPGGYFSFFVPRDRFIAGIDHGFSPQLLGLVATWMSRWKLGSKVRISGLYPQYTPFIGNL